MTGKLRYVIGTCSEQDIVEHLEACDLQFRPPLSARVAVVDYARKLALQAITHEAWDGDVLVGLVASYVAASNRSCYITNVSVLAEFTGRGIAKTLLGKVGEYATRLGLVEIQLEVSKASIEAIELYASLGFQPVESRGDQVLMRQDLAAGQTRQIGESRS